MPLAMMKVGKTGKVKIISGDEKMKRFLFSLGCSEGEDITLISILGSNYIVSIKDSRYAIDRKMAQIIQLC